jgi:hypothetical protein
MLLWLSVGWLDMSLRQRRFIPETQGIALVHHHPV